MVRILFVCHGNICRSPMAQSVMTYLVKERNLEDRFIIDSMATSTEEIGNPPHRGTVEVLRREGIPLIKHRARQLSQSDYDDWDYIIGMDRFNYSNLKRMTGGDKDNKVHLLLEYTEYPGDIADPWYTDDFDTTFTQIKKGCEALLSHILLYID